MGTRDNKARAAAQTRDTIVGWFTTRTHELTKERAVSEIEKMNLESEDLVADRIEQLLELFPEVTTECGERERERE